MKDILIIGGGKIGETIARFLAATPDYALTVADRSREALATPYDQSGELLDDNTDRITGHCDPLAALFSSGKPDRPHRHNSAAPSAPLRANTGIRKRANQDIRNPKLQIIPGRRRFAATAGSYTMDDLGFANKEIDLTIVWNLLGPGLAGNCHQ